MAHAEPVATPLRESALRLAPSTVLLYALPGLGLGFMQSLIQFYLLKFSTDLLLLPAAWMGLMLGISRIWDGISDPIAGYWSDHTHGKLGRRRPWLLAAGAPLALGFAVLWSPPAGIPTAALAAWIGAALLIFVTAQTAFQVPHLALAAELTVETPDRNRVFGVRLALVLFGFLLAAVALAACERAMEPRDVVSSIALVASTLTAGLCALCAWRIHEPRRSRAQIAQSPYRAFGDVLRNPPARLLLGVLFLEAVGFGTMTTSMVYASEYLFERAGFASLLLASALVSALASVPVWLRLAHVFSRRDLWIASLVGRALAFGALFTLPSAMVLLVLATVVIGACFGGGSIFGPGLKADVIDADEQHSGERRDGTFFATWNVVDKGAQGSAIALAGFVLALSGFQPNVPQDPSALFGIRMLYSGLPCIAYVAAALLLARFRAAARMPEMHAEPSAPARP